MEKEFAHLNDKTLCNLLVDNDTRKQNSAITELEKRYKKGIITYTRLQLTCKEDIEDVYQEALFILINKLNKGIEVTNFNSFMITICLNLCKRKQKEIQKKHARLSETYDENIHLEESNEIINIDLFQEILEIISTFKEKDKHLFQMYYQSGFNLRELADQLQMTHAALRQKHGRILNRIKQEMIKKRQSELKNI